jgi:hypothetical protein
MSKANGVVGRIGERAGKYGPMYSIKLENDETWYGTKGTKPDVNVGDTVEFNFTVNPRGYSDADVASITVLEAGSGPAPAAAPAAPTEGRVAFDRKQAVIVYQSSRKDAIEFIKLANEAGILDLPSKGSKADKYAALQIFVDMATNDLYYNAMSVYNGLEPGDEG